jgi:hypothetical protein
MRRSVIAVVTFSVLLAPFKVDAGSGDRGSIEVDVTDVGETGGGSGGGPPSPCGWRSTRSNEFMAEALNAVTGAFTQIVTSLTGVESTVTVTYYIENRILHRYDATSGLFEYAVEYECAEGAEPAAGEPAVGATDWFTATDPDPQILLVRTMIDRKVIATPVPAISPPPNRGVPVNFGMWLGVEPAGPYVVRAGFNDRVWARRTATLVSTEFDPGNGTRPIVCDGIGTPIPDSARDEVDEGPCGYKYRTYDDVTSDLTFTITTRYQVRWDLSDGRTGLDPDIVVSTSFPYDVYEIQTVGQSDSGG